MVVGENNIYKEQKLTTVLLDRYIEFLLLCNTLNLFQSFRDALGYTSLFAHLILNFWTDYHIIHKIDYSILFVKTTQHFQYCWTIKVSKCLAIIQKKKILFKILIISIFKIWSHKMHNQAEVWRGWIPTPPPFWHDIAHLKMGQKLFCCIHSLPPYPPPHQCSLVNLCMK